MIIYVFYSCTNYRDKQYKPTKICLMAVYCTHIYICQKYLLKKHKFENSNVTIYIILYVQKVEYVHVMFLATNNINYIDESRGL